MHLFDQGLKTFGFGCSTTRCFHWLYGVPRLNPVNASWWPHDFAEKFTAMQQCTSVSPSSPTSGVSLNFQVDKSKANQMHVESKGHSRVSHSFHVYTKNARLHNDERLAEVLAEVSSMQWDVIIFSETRSSHDIIELDDGVQSHVCFGIGRKTSAAGVAILMHSRHKKWAKRNVVLSERVLYVDVQIGKNKIRIIAAYAPHAGYSEQDFAIFLNSYIVHYMVRTKMVVV